MSPYILLNLITALFLCSLLPVAALSPEKTEGLIQEALEKNAELDYYREEIAVMQGERRQAGLWKNPELEVEYGRRQVTDSANILQGTGFTRGVMLRQTFEFPGKATLRKAVAAKNVEIAKVGMEQFQCALASQVRLLSMRYLVASENAREAEIVEERGQDLIRFFKKRPLTGTQSLLEIKLIESSLVTLQKRSMQFALEKEELRLQMNALLGRPDSFPLTIEGTEEIPRLTGEREQIVLAAFNHNYLLKIRTMEIQRAARQTDSAKLEAMPDFQVGPFYSEDNAGEKEVNIGLSLSMPLPVWNRNQGNIDISRARQRQANALLLDARRKIEQQVLQSFRAYSFHQNFFAKIPQGHIAGFREAADLADRQFRLGTIDIRLFLDTQEAYLNALQTRQETKVEIWKNLLDLRLLCGGQFPGEKGEGQ